MTKLSGAHSRPAQASGQQCTFTLVQKRWVRVNLAPTSSVHLIKIPALPSRQGKNSVAALCAGGVPEPINPTGRRSCETWPPSTQRHHFAGTTRSQENRNDH